MTALACRACGAWDTTILAWGYCRACLKRREAERRAKR